MNCNKKLANQHLIALFQQASRTFQYWLGLKNKQKQGMKQKKKVEILEKFTNLPYYAFLMEQERGGGGGGEKGKKEPLFSCYCLHVSDVGSPSFS